MSEQPRNIVLEGTVFSRMLSNTTEKKPSVENRSAATVGGVTSGGFFTTGGYNKVVGETKSGKYSLRFEGKIVSSIRLSADLYEQAQRSAIAKYINESTKCIDVLTKVERTKEETEALLANALNLATGTALESGMVLDDWRGFPSKEKCQEIRDWLCDK